MPPGLHRDRGELRQHLAVAVGGGGDVADRPGARAARHAQVRLDGDPAAAALREVEGGGQRVRPGRRPPTRGSGTAAPRRRRSVTESAADRRDLGAEPHLDPARAQRLEGVAPARRRERVQEVVLHLDQHDPGPAHVEGRVVLAEHHGEQLGERAGRLDAGRSAADDDEGEPAAIDLASGRGRRPRSARSTWFRRRVASSSVYSGKPCSAAPRSPEPGHGGTGGQHEVVEREVGLALDGERASVPVDAGDAALTERARSAAGGTGPARRGPRRWG